MHPNERSFRSVYSRYCAITKGKHWWLRSNKVRNCDWLLYVFHVSAEHSVTFCFLPSLKPNYHLKLFCFLLFATWTAARPKNSKVRFFLHFVNCSAPPKPAHLQTKELLLCRTRQSQFFANFSLRIFSRFAVRIQFFLIQSRFHFSVFVCASELPSRSRNDVDSATISTRSRARARWSNRFQTSVDKTTLPKGRLRRKRASTAVG